AIGHVGSDLGQLGALTGHDAADERGEGDQVSGELAFGLARISLYQGISYGTILAEVVTHRMLLLLYGSTNREYTMRQPLKRPFQNDLEKVSGSEVLHAACRQRPLLHLPSTTLQNI